jgi:hypothetical protein
MEQDPGHGHLFDYINVPHDRDSPEWKRGGCAVAFHDLPTRPTSEAHAQQKRVRSGWRILEAVGLSVSQRKVGSESEMGAF